MNEFTWSIQNAGYDFTQIDEMGETNFQHFIKNFKEYQWFQQLDHINTIKKGAVPTLCVDNSNTNQCLWISIMGDRTLFSYLIGYVYPTEKSILWGIGKRKTRWVEIYEMNNEEIIIKCFMLFFENNYNQLEETLKRLHKYDELEEWNPNKI